MLSEPMTPYKLMNLYVLKQANFPLTDSQLSDFFLKHEYTTYFTLQQALNELLEVGLIRMESDHNILHHKITRRGEDTLSFFGKNTSPAIIDGMGKYLRENWFHMQDEVGIVADYYKSVNQDYIVHCKVREGKTALINLGSSVPDREQVESMCSNWERKSREIYAFTMKVLTSD